LSSTAERYCSHADRLCRLFCNVVGEVVAGQAIREATDGAITKSQFAGLEFIYLHPSCCIKDLARGLGVSHPAAVKLVERLVARQFVRRRISATDRRVVQLRPTAMGARLVKLVQQRRAQLTEQVLDAMAEGTGQRLLEAMTNFVRSAIQLSKGQQPSICLHCGVAHDDECPVHEAEAWLGVESHIK